MKTCLHTALILPAFLLLTACTKTEAASHEHIDTALATSPIVQTDFTVKRCMNLGNALEAEHEGAWGYSIRERDFKILADAGFDTVRIPIRWSGHADQKSPYLIDPKFMGRVKTLVAQAQAQNLGIILDLHHYRELMNDVHKHERRFLALWQQISTAFSHEPNNVAFELLNEPMGNMTPKQLNALYAKTLSIIRRTNPNRKVIIGGTPWNNLESMETVDWPKDDNIIATFHYYGPHEFTHQGASWEPPVMPMGVKWGSKADWKDLRDSYASAKAFSAQTGLHVFIGEFGTINTISLSERNQWLKAQRLAMEADGFSWCAWDFSGAFNSYDIKHERWLPGVLDALMSQ